MRLRVFAFILALAFAAAPVLGVVCQMDCGQPLKSAACHESTASSKGPGVRSTHHPCDHDHTGGSPAIATSTAGVREAIGTALVALSVPPIAYTTAPDVGATIADMHGLPDLSGRSVSSRTTVLRI